MVAFHILSTSLHLLLDSFEDAVVSEHELLLIQKVLILHHNLSELVFLTHDVGVFIFEEKVVDFCTRSELGVIPFIFSCRWWKF